MTLDFAIAGFPKCGSFSVYNVLNQHSAVRMSQRKEPSLFDQNYANLGEFLQREFTGSNGNAQLLGEATVEYAIKPESIKRLFDHNPGMKIILVVRDPVERAYSHYWHRMKTGFNVGEFSELIREREASFPVNYSLYFRHISKLLEVFPREQVHILGLEDFVKDFERETDNLLRFLNLNLEPLEFRRDNQSKIYKNKFLARCFRMIRNLNLRSRMNQKVYDFFHSGYRKIKERNLKPLEKPELSEEDRQYLEEVFRSDVQNLKSLIKKDLSFFDKYINTVE